MLAISYMPPVVFMLGTRTERPACSDSKIYVYVHRSIRGHEVTLAKKQCRLDIRKFSFSVTEWNILSADCVGASSVCIITKNGGVHFDR